MRKLAIAMAFASTALATPAVARDHSVYAGLEGGAMWVEDADFDYTDGTGRALSPGFTVMQHAGYDFDAIAGYDFGLLRVEGELGYKHAGVSQLEVSSFLSGAGPYSNFDATGHSRAITGMVNALLDYGDEGFSGYAGAGI